MAKASRVIGLEILEGIRQIKRGEIGRTTTVPSVASNEGSDRLRRLPMKTFRQLETEIAEEGRRKK